MERARENAAGVSTTTASTSRSSLLVAPLLVLATFLLCVFPLNDTDFWWHLRTGQLIWERGDVPRSDWFLFSDSDRPWIDLHWGFQLLMTALYSLGGVNLVILVKAAVLAAAVGIGWFATGRGLPAWLRAGIWIPAVICISGRGYERPEMLSQLFLAVWLWVAFRVETQPKWIWMLPVVQVVWINCHALFVLGLVIGGCFALDYFMRWTARGRFGLEPNSSQLTPVTVVGSAIAGGFAALLNPYFLDGALFPLVLYRKFSVEQDFYSTRIGEFQSPVNFLLTHGFQNIYLDAQLTLGLLALTSFFAGMIITRRWSPFRLLVFAAFSNLAWEASRNVNIFAIVAAIIAVANLADVWQVWSRAESPDVARNESLRVREKQRGKAISTTLPTHAPSFILSPSFTRNIDHLTNLALIVWIGLTITGVWGQFAGEQKPFGLGERPWWFAHEAVQFAGKPGFPDRAIISHIGLAATYEFHLGPDKKVLLDPRLEVSRQQTFAFQDAILAQMARGDRSWELQLRDAEGRLPVVILDSRGSRPMINGLLQTRGWRLVYADPAAAVFLTERQADELKLPPADPAPLMTPP